MANSKRARILEYLKNTLLPSITVANGYNTDVKIVERGIRNIREMSADQLPALFISMNHEKRQRRTHNQFSADLQVVLTGYVANTKGDLAIGDGTGVELDLDNFIEDLTKAIEADPLQGGLVWNTEITDMLSDDGDLSPNAGMVMSVVFAYVTEGVNP